MTGRNERVKNFVLAALFGSSVTLIVVSLHFRDSTQSQQVIGAPLPRQQIMDPAPPRVIVESPQSSQGSNPIRSKGGVPSPPKSPPNPRAEPEPSRSVPKTAPTKRQRRLMEVREEGARAIRDNPPKQPNLTLPPSGVVECPSNQRQNDTEMRKLDCKRRLPQVIGIGVEKCGTAALSFLLSTHPNLVHAYPFEVYFWTKHMYKGMDWYRNRMPVSSKYQLTMEKTPNYFTSPTIQRDIQRMMPDSTKFILVVRDPVVRALSHYVHLKVKIKNPDHLVDRPLQLGQRSICFINNTFETTVVRPNGALMDYNCILTGGIYHQTFNKWLSVFPRERFFIIDGDQFQADPLPILKEIESFLQLPKFFDGSHIYFDESKGFFCRRGYKPKQTCLGEGKGRTHPVIEKRVEQRLRAFFRPHNEKLYEQIGRTFDWK